MNIGKSHGYSQNCNKSEMIQEKEGPKEKYLEIEKGKPKDQRMIT